MPRRLVFPLVLLAAWLTVPAPAATAEPQRGRAWVLVDGDNGAVLEANNDRSPLPAASAFKVLTALVAVRSLPADTDVPVSPRAQGMPARKINMKTGQRWRLTDVLHAVLMVSANDAAVALAERVGGTLAGFDALLVREAQRLGLRDHPVLHDPAGLDDEFAYEGGNLISARDMAIVARAALSDPRLAAIVARPDYRFVGGDGVPHRLLNHNLFLKLYPGAIGVKTGHTRRAGRSLIAAARRGGRTMLTVILGGGDTYNAAAALLDRGFTAPALAGFGKPRLPEAGRAVAPTAARPSARTAPPTTAYPERRVLEAQAATTTARRDVPWASGAAWAALVIGGAPAVAILLRRRRALDAA